MTPIEHRDQLIVQSALLTALQENPVPDADLPRYGLSREELRRVAQEQGLMGSRTISQMLGLSSPESSWRKRINLETLPKNLRSLAAVRADNAVRLLARQGAAVYDEVSSAWSLPDGVKKAA
jgi:hypothetical protein